MPIQLSLSPTSIRPYTDFVNASFVSRRRGVCGSVVQIGLKKKSNGKDDYSVAMARSWRGSGPMPTALRSRSS